MSHTPGPWTAHFAEDGGYDCMTHAWGISANRGLYPICELDLSYYGQRHCDDSFRSAIAEANARLITAAPDLLEAAHVATSFLRHLTDDALGKAGAQALTVLRAAITKAEAFAAVDPSAASNTGNPSTREQKE